MKKTCLALVLIFVSSASFGADSPDGGYYEPISHPSPEEQRRIRKQQSSDDRLRTKVRLSFSISETDRFYDLHDAGEQERTKSGVLSVEWSF